MGRFGVLTILVTVTATAAACGRSNQAGVNTNTHEQPVTTDPAKPTPDAPGPAADGPPAVKQVSLAEVGLDATSLDRSADPCTDFYQFACGGWMATTKIPDDRSRFGRFTEIHQRNEATLKTILEDSRTSAGKPDPITKAIGAFYGACMDETAIETAGTTGIDALLAAARRVKDHTSLVAAITALHRHGIWAGFSWSTEPDFKDSSTNILFLDTDGLGLPDRDYYLEAKDNPGKKQSFAKVRKAYRSHIARMFMLTGKKKSAANRAARDVMRIETAIAKLTKTKTERRVAETLYNRVDRDGLAKLAPKFDWNDYFDGLGHGGIKGISVTTPRFFKSLDKLMKRYKPSLWRSYLEWHVLRSTAATLPKKFVDEAFKMAATLSGQKQQRARWKRCVAATTSAMPENLGRKYVEVRFSGDSKKAAVQQIHAISEAFRAEVNGLAWMDAKTRTRAIAKLDLMSHLIGYPDKWKTYDFKLDPTNYAANALAAQAHEMTRQLDKVDKPRDRSEWQAPPQIVNAWYNWLNNQMTFPAGILQPPFFAANRPIPVNLGAMGMIVGHELTHGFDDQGSKFDGNGNMNNWWQPADEAEFKKKAQCLTDQYSAYEPLPGLTLNGKLTLGENIADLGGIKLAFHAYRQLRKNARTHYKADGFSEDQLFFVAVGNAWCNKARDAEIKRRVVTDPHSPPRFRVNGSLSNTPEFAEAFSCKQGTAMRPNDTCEVW